MPFVKKQVKCSVGTNPNTPNLYRTKENRTSNFLDSILLTRTEPEHARVRSMTSEMSINFSRVVIYDTLLVVTKSYRFWSKVVGLYSFWTCRKRSKNIVGTSDTCMLTYNTKLIWISFEKREIHSFHFFLLLQRTRQKSHQIRVKK